MIYFYFKDPESENQYQYGIAHFSSKNDLIEYNKWVIYGQDLMKQQKPRFDFIHYYNDDNVPSFVLNNIAT